VKYLLFSIFIIYVRFCVFSQCPNVGFYTLNDHFMLNQVSPVDCSYEVWLVHFNLADAQGFAGPGFSFQVTTNANSNTNNSIEISVDGTILGGLAPTNPGWTTYLGQLPNNSNYTIYTTNANWNPNVAYSFKWCDNCNNGCGIFPYKIFDHADVVGNDHATYLNSVPVLSGSFIHTFANQCFIVTLPGLKGIASYSGPGITDDLGAGRAKFNAALAGPGTHTITYCWDDEKGCSNCSSQQITVIAPTADAGQDHEICIGQSVQIGGNPSASSGTGENTYVYQWTPSTGLSDISAPNPIASPTSTTTYQLVVTDHDGVGCSDTSYVQVIVHPLPNVSVQAEPSSICIGDTAVLTAFQGIDYIWDNTIGQGNDIAVSPQSTTNYTVTGTDSNGCTNTSQITITVFDAASISINASNSQICEEQSVTLTAMGGSSYIWENNVGIGNSITVNPTETTTYSVTGTDSNGCEGTAEITIEVYNNPFVDFYAEPLSACPPATVFFTNTSDSASYLWNFGSGETSSAQSPSHTYLYSGNYTVSLTAISAEGCSSTLTFPDYISIHPNPKADFTVTSYLVNEHDVVFFNNISIGGNSWFWDFGDTYNNSYSDLENPSYIYENTGIYDVWLYVENQWGCRDSISKQITVQRESSFYIPNAFSPNADGINDYFGPFADFIRNEDYEMHIYNRFGELLFYTNNMNIQWDGSYYKKGTRNIVPVGTYIYTIQIKLNNRKKLYTGSVNVIY